jgi:hypothetical protein
VLIASFSGFGPISDVGLPQRNPLDAGLCRIKVFALAAKMPLPEVVGMQRRDFIVLLGGTAAAWPLAAPAQQSAKANRLALVNPSTKVADMGTDPNNLVFFEELKRLGYAKGTNLIVDLYSGEGRTDHYDDVVSEVVSTQPDLIATSGTPLTSRFKKKLRAQFRL